MDEYSSRRNTGGLFFSRKGPSLVLRDSAQSAENNHDHDGHDCSQIGCSSKLHPMKGAQVRSPSKAKSSKANFQSSAHGKDGIGSSSRTPSAMNTSRRSFSDQKKKLPCHVDTDSDTGSLQDESEEVSISIPTSGKAHMRVHYEPEDDGHAEGTSLEAGNSSLDPANRFVKGTVQKFGLGRQDSQASSTSFAFKQAHLRVHPEPEDDEIAEDSSLEAGNSSLDSASRFVKATVKKFGLGRQDSQASSSSSFAFKHANQVVRNSSNASRHNQRNLRCNSIPDVFPSGYPSSAESSFSRKRDTGRKRIDDPESSSSVRGKRMSGLILDERRNENSSQGISISDSRRTRNLNATGDNDAAAVRARRFNARTRLSNQANGNRLPVIQSPLLTPSSPQSDISLDAIGFSFEDPFTAQTPLSHASSFSRSSSGSEHPHSNRSGSPYEAHFARSFMNRDALRHFNLDGIAEMLLALERIGQEEEPSYEQLLVLESNLFLGGFALHDQHRDMRLDIDNMSYEDLLALEERMGTVSTGVPEEALTECLKKDFYQDNGDCRGNVDDIKCSICQEEYAEGEEVGRLSCDHRYHVECINQWLKLKNWCPICKASATSSPSSLP